MYRVFALACLGLLAGIICAAAEPVWLDVPFLSQERDGCGSASIAMLMRYWSHSSPDPHQIQQLLYSPKDRGIRGSDVERYLQDNKFQTFVFQGKWADLEHHIRQGRPLLVCLNVRRGRPLHYIVVAGFDPDGHAVLANDPARAKLMRIARETFEKDWKAAGNWTLLALPRSDQ